MASPLHKHESSKSMDRNKVIDREKAVQGDVDEGGGTKKAKPKEEPKNEKGQTQGEERDAVDDKSPMGEQDHLERHQGERESLYKSQESEHKDHNNNHREAMRQMHSRHQKAHSELNKRQMEEIAAMAAKGGGDDAAPAAGAEAAPAGAPAE